MRRGILLSFLLLLLPLAACRSKGGDALKEAKEVIETSEVQTPMATDTILSTPSATATLSPHRRLSPLPPDPQEITFQTADGEELQGLYYPAAVNPAPLVVLMHWARGDQSDWYEIAVWLQNRGETNLFPNLTNAPWGDPNWFPMMPANRSYGVFIFSFRGCTPVGCYGDFTGDEWLLDAQAAMLQASKLTGVDPHRIVAIGSSIGADGAVDGCFWLNSQKKSSCRGALSLSPGDYLGIPYREAVRALGKSHPPVAAWCLADEHEIDLCNEATGVGNTAFRAFEIPGGGHGHEMFRPELEPLPMQLLLDFLTQTMGTK